MTELDATAGLATDELPSPAEVADPSPPTPETTDDDDDDMRPHSDEFRRYLQDIEIACIKIPEDARPINEAAVKRLMQSIRDVGLRSPIMVSNIRFEEREVEKVAGRRRARATERVMVEAVLVYGRHRLEACRRLDYSTIPAYESQDDNAAIVTIDENWARAELTGPQRDRAIKERVKAVAARNAERKREREEWEAGKEAREAERKREREEWERKQEAQPAPPEGQELVELQTLCGSPTGMFVPASAAEAILGQPVPKVGRPKSEATAAIEEVAEEMGVSPKTIERALQREANREAGLPANPPAQPKAPDPETEPAPSIDTLHRLWIAFGETYERAAPEIRDRFKGERRAFRLD